MKIVIALVFTFFSAILFAQEGKQDCAYTAQFLPQPAAQYDLNNFKAIHSDKIRHSSGVSNAETVNSASDCIDWCTKKENDVIKPDIHHDPVVIRQYKDINAYYFSCGYKENEQFQPVVNKIEPLKITRSQLPILQKTVDTANYPQLKYVPLQKSPINVAVGDRYEYDFAIQNTSGHEANNVVITVETYENHRVESLSPDYQWVQNGDKNTITIPTIPANGEVDITLNLKALSWKMDTIFIYIDFQDQNLVHKDQRELNRFHPIGTLHLKAAAQEEADPYLLVTDKRWEYCRSQHSDKNQINTCAKEMAAKDKSCFSSKNIDEQLNCIYSLYGK